MDIRQLYNSLSPEDRIIYQQIRTNFRKVYLNAHTNIIGIDKWNMEDDALLDLLDIKVAVLFDRAGKIEGIAPPVNKEEADSIEDGIEKQGHSASIKMNTEMSQASAKLTGKATW